MIPFVTATLAVHWLPPDLAPPSLDVTRVGNLPAYRLAPPVFARLSHAAEKLLSRPIEARPSPEATTEIIEALNRVYAILRSHGFTPEQIPPLNESTPPLPVLPDLPPFDACDPAELAKPPKPPHGGFTPRYSPAPKRTAISIRSAAFAGGKKRATENGAGPSLW